MSSPARPSPTDMPRRRRPVIPPRAPAPVRSQFHRAADIPRRGWRNATVWPDTGVLLSLGTSEDLPERFTRHYRGRARIPRKIENEVRGISLGSASTDKEHRTITAATAAVRALFIGNGVFPKPELVAADLPLVDQVLTALKNLPGGKDKAHSGEAELIALAVREHRATSRRQVIFANDGGASIVAARHNIPTRHAADVLAEMACSDDNLTAPRCLELFTESRTVSSPPTSSCPTDEAAFKCSQSRGLCTSCDALDARP